MVHNYSARKCLEAGFGYLEFVLTLYSIGNPETSFFICLAAQYAVPSNRKKFHVCALNGLVSNCYAASMPTCSAIFFLMSMSSFSNAANKGSNRRIVCGDYSCFCGD